MDAVEQRFVDVASRLKTASSGGVMELLRGSR